MKCVHHIGSGSVNFWNAVVSDQSIPTPHHSTDDRIRLKVNVGMELYAMQLFLRGKKVTEAAVWE